MANFSFIDLFAGIGGFRLALQSVGGTCIGFSEIAPDAINTYCQNFKEDTSANFGDITKLKTLPEHDFMTAGVPCQSWSIAGKTLDLTMTVDNYGMTLYISSIKYDLKLLFLRM